MEDNKMPDAVYVFNHPKSIGDRGFTIASDNFTDKDVDLYDLYHHDDKYQAVVKERDMYKECYEDKKRLARLIDVALSGEEAAKQASLCDLVSVAEEVRRENEKLREALEMVRDADNDCHADGLPTIPPLARAKIDRALEGK